MLESLYQEEKNNIIVSLGDIYMKMNDKQRLSVLEDYERYPKTTKYITDYFHPLDLTSKEGTTHAIYDPISKVFNHRSDTFIKNAYLKKVGKSFFEDYYFRDYKTMFNVTYELNNHIKYYVRDDDDERDNIFYLNLMPQMKYDVIKDRKPYNEFKFETQQNVELLKTFIYDVIANKNKINFDFICMWITNLLHGNKNKTCIFLKSIQGVGKTKFSQIIDGMLNPLLSTKHGFAVLTTKFTEPLRGSLLQTFEEMPAFSSSEFVASADILKKLIDSDTFSFEGKGTNAVEGKNFTNYIICSNHQLYDSDGRRYFQCTVNTKYEKDTNYFDQITNAMTEETFYALWNWLIQTYDITDFHKKNGGQGYMPITEAKISNIVCNLNSVTIFLKFSYVLHNRDINCKTNDLYEEYKKYSELNNAKNILGLHNFYDNLLVNYSFEAKKIGGYYYYKIAHKDLYTKFKIRNYIHPLDNYISPYNDALDDYNNNDYNITDYLERENIESMKNKIIDYEKTIEQLQTKLRELESTQTKQVIEDKDNDDPKLKKKIIKKVIKKSDKSQVKIKTNDEEDNNNFQNAMNDINNLLN